ncbi:MAG: hypothetical protein ACE14P_08785 [Methanotrichaceae archaeon]
MRLLALILFIALILGLTQAIPLQGGNDAVKCTLFGLVKTPASQDMNNTQAALELDVGLLGSRNATYELVDSKDNIYKPSAYKNLQPGRTLLVFSVPESALYKFLKVTPMEGKPFNINWWKTPKGIIGDITIRYYGVVDWVTQPDQQAIAYELKIANNGTTPFTISPDNFTLLDQWGWPYYSNEGFAATEIPAKKAIDVNLVFGGISPFSRPSVLAYDYATSNQITIDLDKDMGQLTDAQIYGASATQASQAQTEQQPQTTQMPQTAQALQTPQMPQFQTTQMPEFNEKPQINQIPAFNQMPQISAPVSTPAKTQGTSTASTGANAASTGANAANTGANAASTGASVASIQTSAPAGDNSAQSAKNATAKATMSLKDQINASKQRLSGVKSGLSGGQSTVGQQIGANINETKKRLEAMKKGLQNTTKNQTQNNSTASQG